MAARPTVQLVDWSESPLDPAIGAAWPAVATHTHNLRSRECSVDDAADHLIGWCDKHRIAAVGLGSPWEPDSRASYTRCEGPDRERYDAGLIRPADVMDHDAIQRYFSWLNERADGTALFYQDNETPKCRYGHLWWFGFHYDVPAWHDYSQDRPIWYHDGDSQCELNPLSGQPFKRRPYLEIVASQRRHGARGVWAHPTSWWLQPASDGSDKFITNIAAECAQHLWIDGGLDGLAVVGYQSYRPEYQRLWYRLLDTGAVVPGFAETDTCFDRANLLDDARAYTNRLHITGQIDADTIRDAAAAGACVFGSGGLLVLSVDGVGSGGRVDSQAGKTHDVLLQVQPRDGQSCFSRLELIGPGGTVLWSGDRVREGELRFTISGVDGPAYLLARAWGEHDDPEGRNYKAAVDHCLCNPVYLQPKGFELTPMRTAVDLTVGSASPWKGGHLIVQDVYGDELERVDLRQADSYRAELPANARIQLQNGDRHRSFYLLMENPRAQTLSRYLWDGWFRRDFPDAVSGNVPVDAFMLDENREALRQLSKEI